MLSGNANRPSTAKREIELDVVRGIAILLAIGWHFNAPTGIGVMDAFLYPGRNFGWAGVDLFFVLSGFLIGKLIFAEIRKNETFNYKKFFVRRVFRLWPTLYVFIAVQLVTSGHHDWHSYLFQTVFHLQNYLGSSLKHLWSLAVEEQFYLIFGVLCFFYAGKITRSSTTMTVLITLLVASPILRYFASAHGWSEVSIQWQTQFRSDALASGVLLAFAAVVHERAFERLLNVRWLWLALTALGCVYLAHSGRTSPKDEAIVYTVAWITSASFLLLTYRNAIVRRIPILPGVLAFLGIYSYTMYVWQFTGVYGAAFIQKHIAHVSGNAWQVVFRYVIAISVAFVVSRAVEKPMMALRERLSLQFPTGSPGEIERRATRGEGAAG